jgi:uncharacterized protein (DUF111 family)
LVVTRTERQQWPAFALTVEGDRPIGSTAAMTRRLRAARWPAPVKRRALAILSALARAESEAHGRRAVAFDPEGLGRLDTVVDVLGCAWGFWRLGIAEATASALNTGRVAPATAVLLRARAIPVYASTSEFELATPTGVAILAHIACRFGALPAGALEGAGYGAGQRDTPGRPNVLAIYRSRRSTSGAAWTSEPVLLLETVIDDMDPRLYPHVTERLMSAGALDVWWTSIGMKKGRPGIAYTVLCRPTDEARLLPILFSETTTLGIRRHALDRWILPRTTRGSQKVAWLSSRRVKRRGEFERIRQQALAYDIPMRKLLK